MAEMDTLREAFEDNGYKVAGLSQNRTNTRIELYDEGAEADKLRSLIEETLEESPLGVNVTTESIESGDAIGTVITLRQR